MQPTLVPRVADLQRSTSESSLTWTLDFGLWTLDFGLWTFEPIKGLPMKKLPTVIAAAIFVIYPSICFASYVIHLKDGREFVTDRLNALIKM